MSLLPLLDMFENKHFKISSNFQHFFQESLHNIRSLCREISTKSLKVFFLAVESERESTRERYGDALPSRSGHTAAAAPTAVESFPPLAQISAEKAPEKERKKPGQNFL
jgi:hypothetical protein